MFEEIKCRDGARNGLVANGVVTSLSFPFSHDPGRLQKSKQMPVKEELKRRAIRCFAIRLSAAERFPSDSAYLRSQLRVANAVDLHNSLYRMVEDY